MGDLHQFLELLCHHLGCDDAHYELGGREPSAGLWAPLSKGWRVVLGGTGASAPSPAARAKLAALIESFSGLHERLGNKHPRVELGAACPQLDEALAQLAQRAGALRALVLDEDSPVLWGSSELPRGPEDIERSIWIGELASSAAAAGLELAPLLEIDEGALTGQLAPLSSEALRERLLRKIPLMRGGAGARSGENAWVEQLLSCRAIAALRRAPEHRQARSDGLGWLARSFAGIYHLLLVYDDPGFSEFQAAGALAQALPLIERLVLALPPVEPPPKAARVLRFVPTR